MKLVLIGDGESPHLLKWARALSRQAGVQLHAASSRGFAPDFDALIDPSQRLALNTRPKHGGGNVAVLATLPRLAAWLHRIRPDWLHAHYLTSHGTLAWLAQTTLGVPGRLAASAWGSDVLVTPARSARARALLRRVLAASALATSDSQHMAARMRELGAGEVMVFPFGLEALPDEPHAPKEPWLFYANRGFEPIYAPLRVLKTFASIAARVPEARLLMANDGSMRAEVQAAIGSAGLQDRVELLGRLGAVEQAPWYRRAQWFLSLPDSDSVSVSLIEAMAHGCIPIVSDLPANRELVHDGDNGLVIRAVEDEGAWVQGVAPVLARAVDIARVNRAWVAGQGLFGPAVSRFVERLRSIDEAPEGGRGR